MHITPVCLCIFPPMKHKLYGNVFVSFPRLGETGCMNSKDCRGRCRLSSWNAYSTANKRLIPWKDTIKRVSFAIGSSPANALSYCCALQTNVFHICSIRHGSRNTSRCLLTFWLLTHEALQNAGDSTIALVYSAAIPSHLHAVHADTLNSLDSLNQVKFRLEVVHHMPLSAMFYDYLSLISIWRHERTFSLSP